MKCLHRIFREALADENNCTFEDGGLNILGERFTPIEIIELAAKEDGTNRVFDNLFANWLSDWKTQQCGEADSILEQHDQQLRFLRLVDAYKQGTLIPFVGAGLSQPSGYPGWSNFLYKIQRETRIPEETIRGMLNAGLYEGAAQSLADALGAGFDERIESNFAVEHPIRGAVEFLPHLFSGIVITTNFDTVLERCFQNANEGFKEILCGVASARFRVVSSESPHMLLKLHGQPNTSKGRILTLNEYNKHYANSSALNKTINSLYDRSHILFLGCSLNADRLLTAFKTYVASEGHDNLLKHYAFLPSPSSHEERVTREKYLNNNYHIYPIWYSGDHDESITALLIKLHEAAQ